MRIRENFHLILLFILISIGFIFFTPNVSSAYAQGANCSLNVYPQPSNGTKNYTITFTDNTNTPFVEFVNNWYGGNDTIGNGGTGSINSRTYPAGWTRQDTQSYEIRAFHNTSVHQVIYSLSLSLNNGFGGIDVGASSNNTFSDDLCSGHYSPSDITYDAPIPPTPTPFPTITLNVPLLKQTTSPWQSQEYDGASLWSPSAITIGAWGCALTSYTMILKYFGINKLPDNTALNPGTLNSWLRNNEGYIDGQISGYVNPLAITLLSKKAKQINKITAFDALEYTRYDGANTQRLSSDLNNNIPAVIEEPGHFVVAKGTKGNTFSINDPYYINRNDLTSYNNTFISLSELSPSHTNLSYILSYADETTILSVEDSFGNSVGQDFIQQNLVNDQTGLPEGKPLKILLAKKPNSGIYKILASSTILGKHKITLLYYDNNGNFKEESLNMFFDSGLTHELKLSFDQQNSENSNTVRLVSFESFNSDIITSKKLRLISSPLADGFTFMINSAKNDAESNLIQSASTKLLTIEKLIKSSKNSLIKQGAYDILLYDVIYVENNL